MKKKIICIFLILLSAFTMVACADVSYKVELADNGNIEESILVKPDYESLAKAGYSAPTVNERIVTIYKQYIEEAENAFINYQHPNLTSFQKSFVLASVKNSFTIQNGVLVFSRKYISYSDYICYNCMLDAVKIDIEDNEKNFLYSYETSTARTIFSHLKADNSLVKYIKEMFSYSFECPFDVDDIQFHYIYGDTDNKQRSDCDLSYSNGDMYYHQWDISGNNINREITFYKYKNIYTINWYYVALLLTATFLVILLTINKIIKLVKRSKMRKINLN